MTFEHNSPQKIYNKLKRCLPHKLLNKFQLLCLPIGAENTRIKHTNLKNHNFSHETAKNHRNCINQEYDIKSWNKNTNLKSWSTKSHQNSKKSAAFPRRGWRRCTVDRPPPPPPSPAAYRGGDCEGGERGAKESTDCVIPYVYIIISSPLPFPNITPLPLPVGPAELDPRQLLCCPFFIYT